MKTWKKLTAAAALCASLALSSGVCGAEGLSWIGPNDMSLGYVQPGMLLTTVEQVYGPMKETKLHDGTPAYGYGDSVKIVPSSDGAHVKAVYTSRNNGWATPAGVTVGMDPAILQKLYGTGAAHPTKHKEHHMQGYDYYSYWNSSDPSRFVTFVAKDKKIVYIEVGMMEK